MKFVLLLILVGMITPVFAQEPNPSNENSFNSLDVITIGIAVIAFIFSIVTWFKKRPIEKEQQELTIKQHDVSTIIEAFERLSSDKTKLRKEKISEEYWKQKDMGNNKIIFNGEIKPEADRLRESFNQVCAMYELGVFDNTKFLSVYDGNIARFWQILRDDIKHDQETQNPYIAKHFEKLATCIIDSWEKNHSQDNPLPKPYPPRQPDYTSYNSSQ